MTVTTTSTRHRRAARRRPSLAARRVGYAVAAAVNVVLLYLIDVRPGWAVVPFLTDDTTQVLTWVNASLVAGVVANVVYIIHDARWLRSFGDAFVTGIGLAALVRLWVVFPFDFGAQTFDWAVLVRILLVLGIVGSAIAILTNVVSFVSAAASRS